MSRSEDGELVLPAGDGLRETVEVGAAVARGEDQLGINRRGLAADTGQPLDEVVKRLVQS